MTDMLIVALVSGVAMGVFFFVGLWWTVRKGVVATMPAAWFLISFIVRMAVVLGGFYWIVQQGEWQHLAMALLGFILVRVLLTRIAPPPRESGHAS